jgi:hypothetical protein
MGLHQDLDGIGYGQIKKFNEWRGYRSPRKLKEGKAIKKIFLFGLGLVLTLTL